MIPANRLEIVQLLRASLALVNASRAAVSRQATLCPANDSGYECETCYGDRRRDERAGGCTCPVTPTPAVSADDADADVCLDCGESVTAADHKGGCPERCPECGRHAQGRSPGCIEEGHYASREDREPDDTNAWDDGGGKDRYYAAKHGDGANL